MDKKYISSEEKFNIFIEDAKHPFSGWDFSYVKDRLSTEPLKWSYSSILIPYIRRSNYLLDMGTGGGEFLSKLMPLPTTTIATEAYKPNVPIARKNLEPLGLKVVEITEHDKLPFENNYFDLIINRHEEFVSKEVFRILQEDCLFITQQVGGNNDIELNYLLDASIESEFEENLDWNLENAASDLESSGFRIIFKMEDCPKTRCYDIGAIIYYLKAIPWQVPNFSIKKYREKLWNIHMLIQEKGFLELTSQRFIIIAQK